MMTCVALALLFGRGDGAVLLALLAALFIGWTRVALGVHWPSDVMAGWGIGLVWMGMAMSLRNAVAPVESGEALVAEEDSGHLPPADPL
jgi:membrane-associated phospholipid phosphatase